MLCVLLWVLLWGMCCAIFSLLLPLLWLWVSLALLQVHACQGVPLRPFASWFSLSSAHHSSPHVSSPHDPSDGPAPRPQSFCCIAYSLLWLSCYWFPLGLWLQRDSCETSLVGWYYGHQVLLKRCNCMHCPSRQHCPMPTPVHSSHHPTHTGSMHPHYPKLPNPHSTGRFCCVALSPLLCPWDFSQLSQDGIPPIADCRKYDSVL